MGCPMPLLLPWMMLPPLSLTFTLCLTLALLSLLSFTLSLSREALEHQHRIKRAFID